MEYGMGRIILGTGVYSDSPYFMEKFYVNLYSVEELCYLFVEKAELLDRDVMRRDLIQWLDEQCGLSQLAHTLYSLMNQNGSVSAFAGTILEYVGLYPAVVIEQTEQTIRSNEGLNPYERGKAKADHMLQSRKFFMALRQYHSLLAQIPETDRKLRGSIYHNMGVACAKMFMFRQAEEWFRRFQEVHYQRGYRLEQRMDFLMQAGLSFVEAIDVDTHGEVTEESERIYVVARKGTETAANQKLV